MEKEIAAGVAEYHTYHIRYIDYAKLLGRAVQILSCSLPNKQQYVAAVHLMRSAFDDCYVGMLKATHPDDDFGHGPGYMVEPLGISHKDNNLQGIPLAG